MNQTILLLPLVLFVTNAGYSDNVKNLFENISAFINANWIYVLIAGSICIIVGIIFDNPIRGIGGLLIGAVILNWLILGPLLH